MKKLTSLFLVLILMKSIALCQPYKSIFSKGAVQWNVAETIPDAAWTRVFTSHGDTVINNKVYYLILERTDTIGYVREDTSAGKYWFLKKVNANYLEFLMMDMNLAKNDTFILINPSHFPKNNDTVLVDSVFYEDNRKIVQLNKQNIAGYIRFTDGIGPSCGGFMNSSYGGYINTNLLCKFINKQKIYSSDEGNERGCSYSYTGIEKHDYFEAIKIFPNPSTSIITIESQYPEYSTSDIYVFNSIGSMILKESISASNTQVKLPENGVYLLKIVSKNGTITRKVVINN